MINTDIQLLTLTGEQVLPYIDDLARLRMRVFREYPYLYEGDIEAEKGYLKKFTDNAESVMVIALDKKSEMIVGVSTAAPLSYDVIEVKQPFIDHGYALDEIFYFSESVLLPEYRGHGIGRRFFEEREKIARLNKKIKKMVFCAVDREANHPKKPKDYQPLHGLWEKVGFKKHSELFSFFTWREVGDAEKTQKKMTFWMKAV